MKRDIREFFVRGDHTVRQCMERLDRLGRGMLLFVDAEQRLLQTITDGDVRRALLAGQSIDGTIDELIARYHSKQRPFPITGPSDATRDRLIAIMHQHGVSQMPLVDTEGRVVDLTTLGELVPDSIMPVQAVIMAGGFGKRLRPLTDDTPKPMLSIGGKPLIERAIEQLRKAGVRRINITTHFQPDKITGYLGSGSNHGVELNYVSEDTPLGTAGALSLLEETQEPLLVMNGDILTRIDFSDMLRFHRRLQADLTVAVRHYEIEVPYGVVEGSAGIVNGLREKPKYEFMVSAGIYLLEPGIRHFIPAGERFDMTDLISALLDAKRRVASFPVIEYWMDIGHHDDYSKAQQDVRTMRWAS